MSNLFPVGDGQITGVHDDGTPEGIIRARISQGELIKVPANSLDYVRNFGGTAFLQAGFNMAYNADGSFSSINFGTNPGLNSDVAILSVVTYGKMVGVRYRRTLTTPPFSVIVDGVPYDCPAYQQLYYTDNNSSGAVEREALWIVAENLPDIAHTVKVVLTASATLSYNLVLYGMLLERRAGYTERPRLDSVLSQGVLTNANVAVSYNDSVGYTNKGVKRLVYFNSDVAARLVTVSWNGAVIWQKSIPAGSTDYFEVSNVGFCVGGLDPNTLYHKADTGAVVLFTAIGSN